MAKKYYEIIDDLQTEGRWHLGDLFDNRGAELDARDFTYGLPLRIDESPCLRLHLWNSETTVEVEPPLEVQVHTNGVPLDFTFSTSNMPVVTASVAEILAEIAPAQIEQTPVRIRSRQEQYRILNVTARIPCVDRTASTALWWSENDGRPDKLGKARMVAKLVVSPERIGQVDVFRPDEWSVDIVVSDRVRIAFEEADVTGIRFREVG